jgi:hypothetical protein
VSRVLALISLLLFLGCAGSFKLASSAEGTKRVGNISFKLKGGSGFGTVVSEFDLGSTKISLYSPLGSKMAQLISANDSVTIIIDGESNIYSFSALVSDAISFIQLPITLSETVDLLSGEVPQYILDAIENESREEFSIKDSKILIKKRNGKIKTISLRNDYTLHFSKLKSDGLFRKVELTIKDGSNIKVSYD